MVLRKLLAMSDAGGYELCAVLTNPPSARGRHKQPVPTEVATLAAARGIPVFAFDHLRAEAREALAPLAADILVCFDYGRLFGPKFLALFPLGGINLHPSALPRYRGCTPVPAAILAGDRELGVSVQKLALETDSGDIIASDAIPLNGTETTQHLMEGDGTNSIVTDCGARLLDNVLRGIVITAQARKADRYNARSAERAADEAISHANGTSADAAAASLPCAPRAENTAAPNTVQESAPRASSAAAYPFVPPAGTPQRGAASYTPFLTKADGDLNWTHTATDLDRQIRAYTPWPLCSTTFTAADGARTKLLVLRAHVGDGITDAPCGTVLPYRRAVGVEIACGGGTILVATELQWQAKKAMEHTSFMNGARGLIGSVLG